MENYNKTALLKPLDGVVEREERRKKKNSFGLNVKELKTDDLGAARSFSPLSMSLTDSKNASLITGPSYAVMTVQLRRSQTLTHGGCWHRPIHSFFFLHHTTKKCINFSVPAELLNVNETLSPSPAVRLPNPHISGDRFACGLKRSDSHALALL
jgi:hypothetical protein